MKYILSFALFFFATIVQAVPVTVVLDAEVLSGDFSGATATGTLVYDDILISGIGGESISAAEGLEVEFIFFGQTFIESDDIDFDALPSLDFVDGVIIGFDWVVSETTGDTLTDIDEPGVFDFSMLEVLEEIGPGGEVSISGELFVNTIPEVPLPAALPLFIVGLGLLAKYRRSS